MSDGYIPYRTRRTKSSSAHGLNSAPTATPATSATLREGFEHRHTAGGMTAASSSEMTARAALRAAREAGVELEAVGTEVTMRVPDGISPAALDAIRSYHVEIATLLTRGPGGMTGEDWIVLFEDRAANLEHEGGLPRHEAKRRAVDYTLVAWRDRVPAARTVDVCTHCSRRGEPGMQLVPYGTLETGTAVLHTSCWSAWNADRIRRGTAFLNSLGVTADTE
jgi:hypothetical protein